MSAEPVVHIIDDDDAVRDSLELLLQTSGMRAQGWDSPIAFLNARNSLAPGCLLVDIRMPEMDGLTLIDTLRLHGIDLPAIVMTGHGDVPLAVRAMRAGAVDFIEKPLAKAQLLNSIRTALGRAAAPPGGAPVPGLAKLSPREHEVLQGLVSGLPNKTIAHDLGISPRTVEIHRARVMDKMGARSLSDLIRMGLAAGVKPDLS